MVLTSMEEQLDYICKTIIDKISKHKIIYEKMILDLSVCIAYLITNNESVELPESFDTVFEKLREYWFYSAYKDCDKEVSFSYVRVYQTINVYKSFINHNKYVEDLRKAAKRFKRQYKLIKLIYDNSGNTMPQDLCKLLKISSDTLEKRTAPLIEQGFIYIRRIGKFKFYSLYNSGIDLFNLLSDECQDNLKGNVD